MGKRIIVLKKKCRETVETIEAHPMMSGYGPFEKKAGDGEFSNVWERSWILRKG